MADYSLINEKKRLINRSATLLCEHMTELFNDGYEQGYKDGKADRPCIDTEEVEEKAYNRGLAEAWEAARKIIRMQFEEQNKIFGLSGYDNVLGTYSAAEAIAKIKEYEDKQKQDAEIKVGDEVYSDAFDDKGIVTHITTDKVSCVCIICNGFTMMKVGLCGLHKTGRHFDQIAEILTELRGAENDK